MKIYKEVNKLVTIGQKLIQSETTGKCFVERKIK